MEIVSFDFSKLRGRIVEKYGSQAAFARDLGCSEVVFSKKMNNQVKFSPDDIVKIVEMLDIDSEQIGDYFFTIKV